MIITAATTGKVEADNTGTNNVKRKTRGYKLQDNYKSIILMSSAVKIMA
ncbi:hypothetical protein [Crystallibacter degradans]|nr:hypothetical protein [Arthrobacter sp. SF27]NMR28131.1 hypothetical protein [Arthrobacter sp. SF27]